MSIALVTSQTGPSLKNSGEFFKKFGNKTSESVIDSINKMIIMNFHNHTYLNKFFGKENRITYRPEVKKKETTSKTEIEVREFLKTIGMTIDSYVQGTCSFIDKEKDNRQYKIGRILTRNKQDRLSSMFQNDNTRQSTKSPYLLTISRNPFDISMMSTFRGWTSCMSIGSYNSQYVSNDLLRGTLIIYAHKEDDMDIISPMCRVLLKPYYYIHNNTRKVIYTVSTRTYGQTPNNFIENAVKICVDLNCKLVSKDTTFIDAVRCSTLYNDGEVESIMMVFDEDKFVKSFSRNISKYGKKIYKKIGDLNISDENKIDIYLKIYRKYGAFPFPQKYADMNDDLKSALVVYNFKNKINSEVIRLDKYKKIDKKSSHYKDVKNILNEGLISEFKSDIFSIYKFVNLFSLSMIVNYKTSDYIERFKEISKIEEKCNYSYVRGFVEYIKNNSKIKRVTSLLSKLEISSSQDQFLSFFNRPAIKNIDRNFNNKSIKFIEYVNEYNNLDMSNENIIKNMRNVESKILRDLIDSDITVFDKFIKMAEKNQMNIANIIKDGVCFNRAFVISNMDTSVPEEVKEYVEKFKLLCNKIYGNDMSKEITKSKSFMYVKNKIVKNAVLDKEQDDKINKKIYDKCYTIVNRYFSYFYDMVIGKPTTDVLSHYFGHTFSSVRGVYKGASLQF